MVVVVVVVIVVVIIIIINNNNNNKCQTTENAICWTYIISELNTRYSLAC